MDGRATSCRRCHDREDTSIRWMIRLSEDEAGNVLDKSHTGILITLRRDGTPVSLPVWYVADERTIVVKTPPRTKKVARVKRDARASFLVKSGERWIDLLGVHPSGTVRIVDDADEVSRLDAALDAKYAGFRPDAAVLPATTKARYATSTFLRFIPEGRILTWDNSRLLNKGR